MAGDSFISAALHSELITRVTRAPDTTLINKINCDVNYCRLRSRTAAAVVATAVDVLDVKSLGQESPGREGWFLAWAGWLVGWCG